MFCKHQKTVIENSAINPFMSNEISHPYQLDESILNVRVVG